MHKESPIGVFDSGVGGLSVAREIFRQLPQERIIYFGDTAHVPYGSRSIEELTLFGDQISEFLMAKGVKAIVVACNTSSSVSLDHLLEKYPSIPFIGVIEPGITASLEVTKNSKIGVIATQATINSEAHKKLLLTRKPDIEVYTMACPKFVPLVEKGETEGPEAKKAALEYLTPFKEAGIDTLILGCTHYPFLIDVIREVIGPEVNIVDPALETVRQTKELLQKNQGLRDENNSNNEYFVSGNPESFLVTAKKFMGDALQEVKKATL